MSALAAASWPRDDGDRERLMVVEPSSGAIEHARVGDLPRWLSAGDVCVVNDAATWPASLHGTVATGDAIEIRLLARDDDRTFRAVLFGAGDWRTRTEDRPAPPRIDRATAARFRGVTATLAPSDAHARLIRVRFDDAPDLTARLFRAGKPVQYAHVRDALSLFHVQTAWASRPWSFEMPSAGRPLTWSTLSAIRARGVTLARVTHAAGLSSTGDEALDALLPLDERYAIPEETIDAIARAREGGGRVLAIGTTVVRALEGAFADRGALRAGEGVTSLRIGPGFRPRVVDGLLTGMHEPGTSHARLMAAFAPAALLDRAFGEARERGYVGHELGDSTLVWPATSTRSRP